MRVRSAVLGCANDDLERFPWPRNAKRTVFEPSARVAFECLDGFRSDTAGAMEFLCDGTHWVGDPGNCISVGEAISTYPSRYHFQKVCMLILWSLLSDLDHSAVEMCGVSAKCITPVVEKCCSL